MRFLVDNALSPRFAHQLVLSGHNAVHVRDLGMAAADDGTVLELAISDDHVLVSADTDFGTMLALLQLTRPSFILFRGDVERRPAEQAEILNRILPTVEDALSDGAIVAITRDRIRVRTLPIQSR